MIPIREHPQGMSMEKMEGICGDAWEGISHHSRGRTRAASRRGRQAPLEEFLEEGLFLVQRPSLQETVTIALEDQLHIP